MPGAMKSAAVILSSDIRPTVQANFPFDDEWTDLREAAIAHAKKWAAENCIAGETIRIGIVTVAYFTMTEDIEWIT
jgi:hypothetical protein